MAFFHLTEVHSRPQRTCSFWSAPRITTSSEPLAWSNSASPRFTDLPLLALGGKMRDPGIWNARTVLCQFALLYAVQFPSYAVLFLLDVVLISLYVLFIMLYTVLLSLYAVRLSLYAVVLQSYVVLMSLYIVIFPLYLHFVILLAVFCHNIG